MSSKIPRGLQLPAETKKTRHKMELRDTAAVSANAVHKDGALKQSRDNIQRNNVASKVHKGVSRYDLQAELKEQNQNLMAANAELQENLTEKQKKVAELELQFSGLEKENAEIQRNLKNFHLVLAAAKIDPVSGEQLGESAQQNEEHRKEVLSLSTDLMNELKTFSDVASQQHSRLQEIQKTMEDLRESREHMMQERNNFALEAADMEKAVAAAEVLLS